METKIIELDQGINLEMILVLGGSFEMGSPKNEKNRFYDEKIHDVTLTKSFYMGKHQITQDVWEMVMANNPSQTLGKNFPVTDISWNDCKNFIAKFNYLTKENCRLPTESEWEFACKAKTNWAYSFGDNITPNDANYAGSKTSKIMPIGQYSPNNFGLYDMHGNVWEWCEDWYGEYPSAVTDPTGPATGNRRVLRGGSFDFNESDARSSVRINLTPTDPYYFAIGFRLARTADIKTVTAKLKQEKEAKAKQMELVKLSIEKEMVLIPAGTFMMGSPNTEMGHNLDEAQHEVTLTKPFYPAKLKQEKEAKAKQMELVKLSIEKEMVLIPAGTFMMGSPVTEKGRQPSETQHEVTLTKPFYMGKYEVTQEQWESVMGNNPSTYSRWAKYPVTNVSWEDCQEFIKKLNASTKGGYRLPYEAEWEYACRAGTTTAYSFGDSLTKADANIDGNSIKEVGSYKPNAFGLYDMHGNVWEWCEDWYGAYSAGAVTDPKGLGWGNRRVLRGGSFVSDGSAARSPNRGVNTPTGRLNSFGFRLARTP